MPKSKNIEDYFPVQLQELLPGERVTFDLHLYFQSNQHLMLWKEKGEIVTLEFITKYLGRGVSQVWIHRDDTQDWKVYLDPTAAQQELISVLGSNTRSPQIIGNELGQLIHDFNQNNPQAEGPQQEQKKQEIQNLAQELIRQSAAPSTQRTQSEVNLQLREAISNVLQQTLDTTSSEIAAQIAELWKLANIDPDFEHSVDVATFSVIFAMAFGRIDSSLLADIALAGLLHDIGMSQIPTTVATLPWKSFNAPQMRIYSRHVEASVSLISQFAPKVSDRVKAMVSQSHEKFDGSGYPNKLQGFKVDDIAQLLSMADVLNSFASGQWDGTRRTLRDTFKMLENLEKNSVFPEHFNPDVFDAVLSWTRKTASSAVSQNAATVVKEQTQRLIENRG